MEKEKESVKLIELKNKITEKEKQRILNKPYLETKDIYLVMPVGYGKAAEIRDMVLEEMKNRNYIILDYRKKLVNTKLFKEMFQL